MQEHFSITETKIKVIYLILDHIISQLKHKKNQTIKKVEIPKRIYCN
jgi:hypothetical protein